MLRNTAGSWGAVAKALHWTMAVLLAAQVALGLMAVGWRLSPTKIELYFWHKSLGMALLALVLLRLAWRLANPTPSLPAGTPAWEVAAARIGHAAIYAVLLLLPVTGWIVNSAANIPVRIFGLLPLPAIVEPNKPLADLFARVHLALVVALVALVVVHVAAALRHHLAKHDPVLLRMLPGTRSR